MQEADMKRVMAVAVAVLMLMGPVYADGDFGSVGIAGGYSSKDNMGLFGFTGTYQYLASLSPSAGLGFALHSDFSLGLSVPGDLSFSFGTIAGFALEFRLTDEFALNFSIGPAIVAETGLGEASVGIGAGLDAEFSYFFGELKSVGITAGATLYPQFFVLDDARPGSMSFMGIGYIAMSFRYPAPVSLIALPVVDYILY